MLIAIVAALALFVMYVSSAEGQRGPFWVAVVIGGVLIIALIGGAKDLSAYGNRVDYWAMNGKERYRARKRWREEAEREDRYIAERNAAAVRRRNELKRAREMRKLQRKQKREAKRPDKQVQAELAELARPTEPKRFESEVLKARQGSPRPKPQERRVMAEKVPTGERVRVGSDTEMGRMFQTNNATQRDKPEPPVWGFRCSVCGQRVNLEGVDPNKEMVFYCTRCGVKHRIDFRL